MQRKILIVDDERHMLELLKYNFKKEGYDVSLASNGEEGLQIVKKEKPDLVISDIMMPKMNGFDFCKALRNEKEFDSIPFIFLTAKGQLPDKIAGLKTGADDYITKPFIPRELIEMVNTRFRRAQVYKEKADTDDLTATYGRRAIKERLDEDVSRAKRLGVPLSLAFIDIDVFGKVNEEFGHPVGDVVLRDIANVIMQGVRQEDSVGRYGGEEFLVMMPATAVKEAYEIIENVRRNIENKKFNYQGKLLDLKITVSIGLAWCPQDAEDADKLISMADKALYLAKEAGRNKTMMLDRGKT